MDIELHYWLPDDLKIIKRLFRVRTMLRTIGITATRLEIWTIVKEAWSGKG